MATTKLFLDTRKSGKDENKQSTVKIAISHRCSNSYIVTDVRVLPSQWDETNRRVQKHPQKVLLNKTLLDTLAMVNNIMFELQQGNVINTMTASQVCSYIKERMTASSVSVKLPAKKENPNTVEKLFIRYMDNKIEKPRTRKLYEVTLRKIEAFSGKKFHALSLEEITYGWLEDFEKFLAKTAPSANARGIHLRNLRAVINYALKLELIDKYVFRNFTIKKEKTRKRNLSVDVLRRIIFAKLEPWMEKYRDFFVLSFMLRGLNAVDLLALPKPNNGRIEWNRTKTNQPLSLKIEPEAQQIIDRYQGNNLMLEFCENGRNYRSFNEIFTKSLHEIVKYLNYTYGRKDGLIVPDITMYWARHSWATIAASIDIPIDVIGCGLGHSQKSVTEIYIERDPAKVDKANRAVLDWVLYGKKNGVVVDEHFAQGTPTPEKKKRGRPRKVVDPTEVSEKVQPKRKQGRPKKEWRA